MRNASQLFVDPDTATLAQAAAEGDDARFATAIAKGGNPNGTGGGGITPLLYVLASTQNKHGLELLLKHAANPYQNPPHNPSPLFVAAAMNDPSYLRLFLDSGASPNAIDSDGHPLLFKTIMTSRWANMDLLLDRGVDINLRDSDGATPALALAILKEYEQVARLLERGADPTLADKAGATVAQELGVGRLDPESLNAMWRERVREILIARGVSVPPVPVETKAR
jgi:ankyrin repeat protein